MPQTEPMNSTAIDNLMQLLRSYRFDLSTEKHLQEQLAEVLQKEGVEHEREKRLSPEDIPDFMVAGGIVIECKIRNKSSKMDIFRQLSRYASHNEVTALILASNMAMGLPATLNGKPVLTASLSTGWM